MVAKSIISVVAAGVLAFAGMACKINKDANCLNPKAACYKKDTEAPSVVVTKPASLETTPTASADGSAITGLVITFSEPMKNASDKGNYSISSGSITAAQQIDDKNYQLTITGVAAGLNQVVITAPALLDLSGNSITNGTMTVPLNGIQVTHSYVSSQAGAYNTTDLQWKNSNLVSVNYTVSSTDCASPTAYTGTNVTGTATADQTITTTLGFAQFTDQTTVTVRICQKNVGQGIDLTLSTTIGRDDTSPTSTIVTSNTAPVAYPATITLSCSDHSDKIAYSIGVANPDFTAPNIIAGTLYVAATGVTIPIPTVLAERTRTVKARCLDLAGNKEGAIQSKSFNAELQWADAGLKSENWDWAYWK